MFRLKKDHWSELPYLGTALQAISNSQPMLTQCRVRATCERPEDDKEASIFPECHVNLEIIQAILSQGNCHEALSPLLLDLQHKSWLILGSIGAQSKHTDLQITRDDVTIVNGVLHLPSGSALVLSGHNLFMRNVEVMGHGKAPYKGALQVRTNKQST